jgi:hypothetical protein
VSLSSLHLQRTLSTVYPVPVHPPWENQAVADLLEESPALEAAVDLGSQVVGHRWHLEVGRGDHRVAGMEAYRSGEERGAGRWGREEGTEGHRDRQVVLEGVS